jgi:hypothetical protein
MQIPDLTEFAPGHHASPYPFPPAIKKGEIWGSGRLPAGIRLLAVGWLGDNVPAAGETPGKVLRRLFRAHQRQEWIVDGTSGWHDCELCSGNEAWYPGGRVGPVVHWGLIRRRVRGYGHFLVRWGQAVYMAPVLILHYIVDHGYRPPQDFIEAVNQGRFLSPNDLDWVPPDPG